MKQPPKLALGPPIQARYPNIPTDYLEFLRHVSSCANADETAWFLCEDEYNGTTDKAFA